MTTQTSASEQIEELQRQIEQLRHRSVQELRVKLAEARHTVVALEKQIEELTGKAASSSAAPQKRTRTSISIDQVVAAIRNGATNYRAVANELGCSPITVAKKVETEGKAAGIRSTGAKASFKLALK